MMMMMSVLERLRAFRNVWWVWRWMDGCGETRMEGVELSVDGGWNG
jgi:hypothetical protein